MERIVNRPADLALVFVLYAATAISLPAQTLTTLYTFNLNDGDGPAAALVQGTDGNLYGTTTYGGDNNYGTVFKISPSGVLTTLYTFGGTDGEAPQAPLIQGTDGSFYGTTNTGGTGGHGTVFRITPSGALTTLYSFCAEFPCTDGASPYAGLIQAIDGDLYGTTFMGGASGQGTVFKITPDGTLTTILSFDNIVQNEQGQNPRAGVIQAADGSFYGTTSSGGVDNSGGGTVFKVSASGTLTTLYSFCSQSGCADGEDPEAALVLATDGNFYGTTREGGTGTAGTIFKITPSGTLTTLYSFCSQMGCPDGSYPSAALVQATDGNLYGTTSFGGAGGDGTIFRISLDGTFATIHNFCQFKCADGGTPYGGLVQDTSGDLFGVASTGGVGNGCSGTGCGTVFSLSLGLGPFVTTLPASGDVGTAVQILGTNLDGTTGVAFNGTAAAFTVVSPSLISTTVPAGAATGEVQVISPRRTLQSNTAFVVEAPPAPFAVTLSTAGQVEPFAAESIVSAYGTGLAGETAAATTLPLPTSLGGNAVTVTDSASVARPAPLFYVSPSQVNFEIPAGTAPGTATVALQGGTAQSATISIGSVSPGIFALNGAGLVAAWVLPVISGTQQALLPVYQIASGSVIASPVNLGPSTEQVYLEMYGTGIRHANKVTVTVGGLGVPVLYAGPAPGFAGEDQVNIGPLPQSLAGAGSVNIVVAADGQAANTVNVTVQ